MGSHEFFGFFFGMGDSDGTDHLGLKDDGVRDHSSAVLFAHLFDHRFAELQD